MTDSLYLDTDAVRAFVNQIVSTGQETQTLLDTLLSNEAAMEWTSPGRQNFDDEFQSVLHLFTEQKNQLDILSQRIQKYVLAWEDVAASVPVENSGGVLTINAVEPAVLTNGDNANRVGSTETSSPVGQSSVIDEVTSRLWDGAKAIINTAGFLTKNTVLKGVSDAVGAVDFFFKKMPETETAFRAWEDYNRKTDGWDPIVARQLQENAKKHLDEMGLSGVQDALGTITDTLGDNKLIREAIVRLKDAVSVTTDWLSTLGPKN